MTDDDFAIKLGNRIRELRKIKGVSQLELAYDMDMSMNTISGIELGKISPKIETLRKIAEKLNVTPEEIAMALDAIQSPVSLYEPVYSEGGDTLYIMDQISDTKNKEDGWVEMLSLREAIRSLPIREKNIIELRYFQGKTQMEVAQEIHISQAQVSRLEKNALGLMREELHE